MSFQVPPQSNSDAKVNRYLKELIMTILTADSAVSDELTQQAQIERLKKWIGTASCRKSQIPLFEGVAKLIELGMLRYGTWLTPFGLKTAFSGTGNSDEFQSFLKERVEPGDRLGSLLLELVAGGKLLISSGYRNASPEVIFSGSVEYSHRIR
jgi:hypothetical protein